ncbi:MAG: uracil phosphoribosyltransferase [Bacteroides sp.]|nr:uracil phosphoribosyltransferase [Bacteroides sp.]MCM1085998.1 uracil phosphoribosyltransferase [Bacteroides sp.]MCM1168602.1 uracil phosphoribosyltransferase [Bacteroides sp.]MCM1531017.1 uracil phosphoribosyltransferase [Ruminococcus flavefaciens]MCM1554989.1 uracil phosphoribosyltransferase [Bacteroides sp.]
MEIKLLEARNSWFLRFMSELRDREIQRDPMRFRENLRRIGQIFAYEISKELSYQLQTVQTPLGEKAMNLPVEDPVIASILRAGLPLHEGFLSFFDRAGNAFISAYRKHDETGAFQIKMDYVSCPDLQDRTLILCDPMLATGSSMAICHRALLEYGQPRHTHLVSVIAAQEGIDYLQKQIPSDNCTLWVGSVDEELTAQSYIVPGLGDAGDLAFGCKLQN